MRDESVLTTDWNDRIWRAWPSGKTLLINDPYFKQKRMDYYGADRNKPDAATYRAVDFITNFYLTAFVGIVLVLIVPAVF